jgi:hypothetical protein
VHNSRDADNNIYADNSWDPKNANESNNIANSGVNSKKGASQAATASEKQATAEILAAVATSTTEERKHLS